MALVRVEMVCVNHDRGNFLDWSYRIVFTTSVNSSEAITNTKNIYLKYFRPDGEWDVILNTDDTLEFEDAEIGEEYGWTNLRQKKMRKGMDLTWRETVEHRTEETVFRIVAVYPISPS